MRRTRLTKIGMAWISLCHEVLGFSSDDESDKGPKV